MTPPMPGRSGASSRRPLTARRRQPSRTQRRRPARRGTPSRGDHLAGRTPRRGSGRRRLLRERSFDSRYPFDAGDSADHSRSGPFQCEMISTGHDEAMLRMLYRKHLGVMMRLLQNRTRSSSQEAGYERVPWSIASHSSGMTLRVRETRRRTLQYVDPCVRPCAARHLDDVPILD